MLKILSKVMNKVHRSISWDSKEMHEKEQIEDLLKALYHSEETGKPIHLHSLCDMAQISEEQLPATFDKMVELHLLVEKSYRLTEEGRKQALSIIRRHRLYETYLSEHSGYAPDKWHKMAHEKEHHLSKEETDKMSMLLGNPLYDPHGDPIPTALSLTIPKTVENRTELNAGDWLYVTHIEDNDEAKYNAITKFGITKASIFCIEDINNVYIRIFLEGDIIDIPKELFGFIDLRQANKDEIERSGGKSICRLTQLNDNQQATIQTISPACTGLARRRLMDLGFVNGSNIIIDVHSPLGNPTAYLVRGSAIALREDQARYILIRDIKEYSN